MGLHIIKKKWEKKTEEKKIRQIGSELLLVYDDIELNDFDFLPPYLTNPSFTAQNTSPVWVFTPAFSRMAAR